MTLSTTRIHQSRSVFDTVVRLIDMIGIVGSLMLIGATASRHLGEDIWLTAIVAVAIYYVAAEVTGLFRSWHGLPR